MMDEATAKMSDAERITAGLCPECGISLKGLRASAHAVAHWNEVIIPDGKNDRAIKRQRMLREYDKAS